MAFRWALLFFPLFFFPHLQAIHNDNDDRLFPARLLITRSISPALLRLMSLFESFFFFFWIFCL